VVTFEEKDNIIIIIIIIIISLRFWDFSIILEKGIELESCFCHSHLIYISCAEPYLLMSVKI
jgi:hypothetical protein